VVDGRPMHDLKSDISLEQATSSRARRCALQTRTAGDAVELKCCTVDGGVLFATIVGTFRIELLHAGSWEEEFRHRLKVHMNQG
jgi:hypothetical protein